MRHQIIDIQFELINLKKPFCTEILENTCQNTILQTLWDLEYSQPNIVFNWDNTKNEFSKFTLYYILIFFRLKFKKNILNAKKICRNIEKFLSKKYLQTRVYYGEKVKTCFQENFSIEPSRAKKKPCADIRNNRKWNQKCHLSQYQFLKSLCGKNFILFIICEFILPILFYAITSKCLAYYNTDII